MIPEDIIARVRESVNLAELVRETVPSLKKTGRNYQSRCPFHQERTPSFSVNPEMGVFKCFGCGVGGDAFKFVMLTEGLSYPEAIRKLASRVGITIPDVEKETLTAEGREKQVLYGLLEDAAAFYHRYLMESSEGKAAKAYLEKRGLNTETLTHFRIGYAPVSGQVLREAASRKGWSVEILEKAGLLRRKEGGRLHDHFWNRVIFPIWDSQGRIVAFGGRTLGEALPKYINSPETPVYSKSRHLYGLYQAIPTLRKKRHIIILEGYMDVVTCHQFGFNTTVATLGTALTDQHVRALQRYAEKVTLLFDPDAAGAQATLRGGELLLEAGMSIDVVTLPDELDPDEVLLRDGATALENHLKQAVPFMDYVLAQAVKRHPASRPEEKLALAKEVLPLIAKVPDPLLQDEHLTHCAQVLHVEKEILGKQMKAMDKPSSFRKGTHMSEEKVTMKEGSLLSLEEEILLLAILYPSLSTAQGLETLAWGDVRCQKAWDVLMTPISQGRVRISEILSALPEDIQEWLMPLALQQRQYAKPLDLLKEFISAWHRQNENHRLQDLRQEINDMLEGRLPMDSQKMQTYQDLSRRLKGSH